MPSELQRLQERIKLGYHISNDPYIGDDIEWAVTKIEQLRTALAACRSAVRSGEQETEQLRQLAEKALEGAKLEKGNDGSS